MPARRKSPRRSRSPRRVRKRRSSGVRRTKCRLSCRARGYRATSSTQERLRKERAPNAPRALEGLVKKYGNNYNAAIKDLLEQVHTGISIPMADRLLGDLEPLLNDRQKFDIAFLYLPPHLREHAKTRIRNALRYNSISLPITASSVHTFLHQTSLEFMRTHNLEPKLSQEEEAMSRKDLLALVQSRTECLKRLKDATIEWTDMELGILRSYSEVDRFIDGLDRILVPPRHRVSNNTRTRLDPATVNSMLVLLRSCLFNDEILKLATLHLEKIERDRVRQLWRETHSGETLFDSPEIVTTGVIDEFRAKHLSS